MKSQLRVSLEHSTHDWASDRFGLMARLGFWGYLKHACKECLPYGLVGGTVGLIASLTVDTKSNSWIVVVLVSSAIIWLVAGYCAELLRK